MRFDKFATAFLGILTMIIGIAWALLMRPYLGVITFILLGITSFLSFYTD